MRNSNNKTGCTKEQLPKCVGVCRTYSRLQRAYALRLESNNRVKEFRCNVPLEGFPITDGAYTTDFVAEKTTGELMVRECVLRQHISKPKQISLLDGSREYWLKRGVNDWGIVVDADK